MDPGAFERKRAERLEPALFLLLADFQVDPGTSGSMAHGSGGRVFAGLRSRLAGMHR
jgi:hypothetical protein